MRRSLHALSTKAFRSPARWLIGRSVKNCQLPSRGVTLSRNIWCLSSNTANRRNSKPLQALKACSLCQIHTEVDQELIKHLEEEISSEKANLKKSPRIEGWDAITNGAEVTLQRKNGDELIEIRLNVNNSVRPDDAGASVTQDDQAPTMLSKPPFEVNIKRASGTVMTFQCDFYEDHEFQDENVSKEQDVGDLFSINEVSLHTGEMKDSDYFLSSDALDATLYDLLMDMLDERGISNEFITNLIEFCTDYEHAQYTSFLEKLQGIVKGK